MRRVPSLPVAARLRRPLARLPLGGPTGLACAAAGVACVVGIALARPTLPFPQVHDEHRPVEATVASAGSWTDGERRGSSTSDEAGHVSVVLARTTSSADGSTGGQPAEPAVGGPDGTAGPAASRDPNGPSDLDDPDDGDRGDARDGDERPPRAGPHRPGSAGHGGTHGPRGHGSDGGRATGRPDGEASVHPSSTPDGGSAPSEDD